VDNTLVSFVLSLFLPAATVILYHKSYKQALNSSVDQVVYYPIYSGLPPLHFDLPVSKTSLKAGLPVVEGGENDVLGLVIFAI
jgi:hypothetical protein